MVVLIRVQWYTEQFGLLNQSAYMSVNLFKMCLNAATQTSGWLRDCKGCKCPQRSPFGPRPSFFVFFMRPKSPDM